MYKSLALAAAAAVLACTGIGGAAATTSAAPAPGGTLTRLNPYVTDGLLAAATLRCLTSGTPIATLAMHGTANQPAAYATYVNGIRTRAGNMHADANGNFIVPTQVPNHQTNRVQLTLNRRLVVNTLMPTSCGSALSPVVALASLLAAGTRGNAGSYALNHNKDGSVTRWNPCDGSIHVRVNAGLGGAGAVTDTQNALAALNRATGLHFVYDGTTTFVPTTSNSGSQPAQLVIAWAPPGTGAGHSDYYEAGAIGEGGWRSSGTSTNGGASWAWKIVQGFVVVDPGSRLPGGFGSGATRGALLLHELGHVVGLGHTGDASQVMYPVLSSRSYGSYGAGDATGLRTVGASKGCTVAA
jgi:hypothetical protein